MAMHKLKSREAMVKAMVDGTIPPDVMSPGGAANHLGCTRELIWYYIRTGRFEAWTAKGMVLVDISEGRNRTARRSA